MSYSFSFKQYKIITKYKTHFNLKVRTFCKENPDTRFANWNKFFES